MNGSPLLFCHIPKTAGTSVRRALERVYPDVVTVYSGELRLAEPDSEFIEAMRRRASPPSLLYGHFSFGVHRFLDLPPRYATFLRDPVERVVSLYRHHAADETAAFYRRIADGMTLGEFVSCTASEENNNHMCRVIAGVVPRPTIRVHDRTIVDAALNNLRQHFVFIGFVDRFAESMRRLAGALEVPLATDDHVNAAPQAPPPIGAADVRAVQDNNDLDVELFTRARGLVP